MGELVTVATGYPRFRMKHQPIMTGRPELHTATSREVAMFCLADETDTFVLHNQLVGGDVWSHELGRYSDPFWQTIVLRSGSEVFENIPTGSTSTARLDWAEGSVSWNSVAVESVTRGTELVSVAVRSALVCTTCFDGAPCEFLAELTLVGPMGEWRLLRSIMGPPFLTLATSEPSA